MAEKTSRTVMGTLFEPVTPETMATYIKVGTQSYLEHYLYLWKDQNPTYLKVSFTPEVVQSEIDNPHCCNYLIKHNRTNVGILKITIHQSWGNWTSKDALYLHRLYLLEHATGKNIGKNSLHFVENLAKRHQKKVIWLEAMKKGLAKQFYQKNGYTSIGKSCISLEGVKESEKEMLVMGKTL